jgi:hypothetical protein
MVLGSGRAATSSPSSPSAGVVFGDGLAILPEWVIVQGLLAEVPENLIAALAMASRASRASAIDEASVCPSRLGAFARRSISALKGPGLIPKKYNFVRFFVNIRSSLNRPLT